MYYDRIPERSLEPPDDRVFCYCTGCGGEIYEGCEYFNIDGDAVCENCLGEFAVDYFSSCYDANTELYTIDGEVVDASDLWVFAYNYFSYCHEVAEPIRPEDRW